jgi:hypothetical protein
MAATPLRLLRRSSGQLAGMAQPRAQVTIARNGGGAWARRNDPRRGRLRRQYGGRSRQGAERTMGGIVWLPGRRRVRRGSARIREAMLPKQARRSLCGPFRSHNAGQQGVDDERIGDDTADKAAP